ncbi:hypothetical protein ONZ45_g19296 [Pleurotus djamor]|nr:hypothetical protein ONZ45_g19296 [Pleurotus djamor]
MSSKRKSDEEASGRDKKKQKIKNARTIPVQTVPSTSTSTNGITTANPKSSSQLPGSLDVERFVEARAFEIDAMHTAMKTASASSTQRAWQALPRHLRRRAASHDVRRVPLRLRDKAKAEMDLPGKKTKKISLPKPGKAKQQSRTEKLLKRQRKPSVIC